MGSPGDVWRRLRLLVRRPRLDVELEEEMRVHLEMRAEANRQTGMKPKDARDAAARRFGNALLLRESSREEWGWPLVDSVLRDARFALRMLARSPGFVVVSLLSLGLGIGVTAAIVGFVNALFFSPLPAVADSHRLVSVFHRTKGGAGDFTSSSWPDYEYYRARARAVSGVAACTRFPMMLNAGDVTERVPGELVSDNYFSVLGVAAAAGRLFAAPEGVVPGADPIVVIGHDLWQRQFGGDRRVVGRGVRIGGRAFTIVGVAAQGFQGVDLEWTEPPALWVPATMFKEAVPALADMDLLHGWGAQTFNLIARLRAEATRAGAADELAALARRMPVDHPERASAWPADLRELADLVPVVMPSTQARFWPGLRGTVVGFLGLLGAVAVLIFAICCINVANLVLARAVRRQRELAIRMSLGAGRRRVMRQLLTENLVLAILGGAAGLLVADLTSSALSAAGASFAVPISLASRLDARIVACAAAMAVFTGVVLTLLPSRVASRTSIAGVIYGEAGGARRTRAHRVLIAAQVASSVVLLVAAGLFLRTLQNAQAADVTERPGEVLLAGLDLGAAGYDEARGRAFYAQLLGRVRALAGVRGAGLVHIVPLGGRRGGTRAVVPPLDARGEARRGQVGFNAVAPGHFLTIGIPILRGRDFRDTDGPGAPPAVIVNEAFAVRYFPGRDAVGGRFALEWRPARTVEIVGVVRDGRFRSYRSAIEPTVYVSVAQYWQKEMTLEVRSAGPPAQQLVAPLRRELAALDRAVALTDVRTARAHFNRALGRERLTASLLGVLGLVALALAAIGIYGILSYTVAQRTREIGVRMALGARPASVLRMVLGRALGLVALGLVIGVLVALAAARLVANLLFGITPADGFVFVSSVLVLTGVALVAGALPARRAARIDPVAALRYE